MCHLVLPYQFTVFSKFIIKVPSNNSQPSELQDCHYFHLRQEAFVLKYLLASSDGLYSIADQDFSISDKTYEEIHVLVVTNLYPQILLLGKITPWSRGRQAKSCFIIDLTSDTRISTSTLWIVLAKSGACEESSCLGKYYTTLML